MKKILMVLLQNAYGVEDGYIPSINKESFVNSHTGRRLINEVLPDNVNIQIRNCSPVVGKESSSNFPPDYTYIRLEVEKINPDVILACGVNARKAITDINPDIPVVLMPHPAYRALSKKTTENTKKCIESLL